MPTSQELYLIHGRSDQKGIGNLKLKGKWDLNLYKPKKQYLCYNHWDLNNSLSIPH